MLVLVIKMQHNIKQINIKNRPCYYFNDMINIKNFDPSLLKTNKLLFRGVSVNIYYIKYITIKSFDHVKIDNENFLYLIFDNVDGYIKESNGNKYLVLAPTVLKVFKKYTKLWDETKNQIKALNGGEPIKYKKDFMNIRFESDYGLPLSKALSSPCMIIVTTSVFEKNGKHYPQFYLHECLYELWKCCNTIEC